MSKSNEKKSRQLGEPYGTACNKMKKQLMFRLMQKCGMDICHQCGEKIEDVNKMSIEHKEPWLDSDDPVSLFYDPDNICFSHMFCNMSAARKDKKHPSIGAYRRGCRCKECVDLCRTYQREYKRKTRNTPEDRQII